MHKYLTKFHHLSYLLEKGADILYAIESKKGKVVKEKTILDYALEWADVNLYKYKLFPQKITIQPNLPNYQLF